MHHRDLPYLTPAALCCHSNEPELSHYNLAPLLWLGVAKNFLWFTQIKSSGNIKEKLINSFLCVCLQFPSKNINRSVSHLASKPKWLSDELINIFNLASKLFLAVGISALIYHTNRTGNKHGPKNQSNRWKGDVLVTTNFHLLPETGYIVAPFLHQP